MRRLLPWLALAPGTAFAGGYYYSDSGIEATGRGGAWVAGADTQFAQSYNPAGLIRIEDPTFNLGWSGVQQNVSWQQAKAQGGYFPESRNTAPPFSVPQIGFAMPLGDKAAFAFGFISPFAPSSEWKQEGPQRYNIVDSSVYQFGVGPSVAVQPIRQLTVGVGAQWSYLQVGRSLDLTVLGAGFAGGSEVDPGGPDPGGDVFVDVGAVDVFTPTFNAGLLVEPHEMVSIGASVTPPARYSARGPLDIDFAGNTFEPMLSESTYSDDDISLEIELPLVLRAGVAVRPVDKLEVEVAWVWQQWSSLSAIRIDDASVQIGFEEGSLLESLEQSGDISSRVEGPFDLPAGLQDVASYRLGAEYRFHESFEGRIGGFYEPNAVPEELVTVSLVDVPKVQVGTGGSVWLLDGRLRGDFAFAWLFFQKLDIRNSAVKQVNAEVFPECGEDQEPALPFGGQEGCIVLSNTGNGRGSSRGWIVGVQLQYILKKPAKKPEPPPRRDRT